MSHTYRSVDDPSHTITVDESHDQLPDPFAWEEVAKLTAAEKKAIAAAEKAEADRIAALPIHVGDVVKVTEEAIASFASHPGETPESIEAFTAWRGTVTEIRTDDGTDVAAFDGDIPVAPLDKLEIVSE